MEEIQNALRCLHTEIALIKFFFISHNVFERYVTCLEFSRNTEHQICVFFHAICIWILDAI